MQVLIYCNVVVIFKMLFVYSKQIETKLTLRPFPVFSIKEFN